MAKLNGKYRDFKSCHAASYAVNVPHPRGTLAATDEPMLRHHVHPRPLVCFRVHAWFCTLSGLDDVQGQDSVIIVSEYLVVSVSASVVSALCNLMDWCPPGSSVHGSLQARILEWVAMPFSRGSS